GRYSVRSGYHLFKQDPSQDRPSSSAGGDQLHIFWKKFWRVPVAPNILIFVWRSISNILSLKSELNRRHLNTDNRCVICNSQVESWRHLFMECEFIVALWRMSSVPNSVLNAPTTTPFLLLDYWFHHFDPVMTAEIFTTLWAIWHARNEFLHQDIRPAPTKS
ncbi:hypothetical protein M569_15475, partial [Genlisea aurea]